MIKKIEFRACISPIMSGIRVGSDMMRVQFDIPKSDIQDAVPLLALTDSALKITVEVDTSPVATRIERPAEEKPKKEKMSAKEKGDFGRYWQAMYKHGALNHPDLPTALDMNAGQIACGDEGVKAAIKAYFDVTSLTFLSPGTFEDFCRHSNLDNLITISRNAAAEVGA